MFAILGLESSIVSLLYSLAKLANVPSVLRQLMAEQERLTGQITREKEVLDRTGLTAQYGTDYLDKVLGMFEACGQFSELDHNSILAELSTSLPDLITGAILL